MARRLSKDQIAFKDTMAAAGLRQVDLERLLGVAETTVNRWCVARDDAQPPPKYARAFLAAYRRLSERDRASLRAELTE